MNILLVGSRPTAPGPIGHLLAQMKAGLEELGCCASIAPWGQYGLGEPLWVKAIERTRDLIEVRRAIRRERPDILFLNTSQDWRAVLRDIPLILTTRRYKVPLVLLHHGTRGNLLYQPSYATFRKVFGWELGMAAGVLTLSEEEKQAIKTLWPQCRVAAVRYPFVPLPTSYPPMSRAAADQHEPVLLFIGRLIESKGVLDLVRAFPLILETVSCQLSIVGDGPAAAQAHDLADRLGIADRVIFTGYLNQQEVSEALAQADLFVLPTFHTEGFPVAVLEAMGAGLPIVTTQVGGMQDWLVENVHAKFVPPRSPNAIARQVVTLLKDSELRWKMGCANRSLIEQFAPAKTMREYLYWMKAWTRDSAELAPASRGAVIEGKQMENSEQQFSRE